MYFFDVHTPSSRDLVDNLGFQIPAGKRTTDLNPIVFRMCTSRFANVAAMPTFRTTIQLIDCKSLTIYKNYLINY